MALGEAVAACGTGRFAALLEAALRALVPFELCMVFAYAPTGPSSALHHNMAGERAAYVVDEYLTGPYLLDPFYVAAMAGRRFGFGVMRDLAPDEFEASEFYRRHYVRTGIGDEMGVFFPLAKDRTAVLSITRPSNQPRFDAGEQERLASAARLLGHLATRHWAESAIGTGVPAPATLESLLSGFGSDVLTERESEVMILVLKGHSSLSIGHVLGISPNTVKIHRRNAYGRLGISSQAELLSLFLATVRDRLLA